MQLKSFLPYLVAILIFVIASLAYFSPVLDGKELFQSDIAQFRGMSKEIRDFREVNHEEPYWTNRAFGGMPTYQLSTYYPADYIKKLDDLLRFLPRPADYLFLYFLNFFILMMALKVDWRSAILGSLAFGFSTYLIIILGVGHNAKAHAIAYMPLVLAGLIWIFDKKYLLGFVVSALGLSLEISASHPQMTYYLFFMGFFFGIFQLIKSIQEKQVPSFVKSISIFFTAAILALGMNATSLMATKEYAAESTRSRSELTINPDGSPKQNTNGLSKEYITEYSYGILETFDLFIPRFMGGSNNENLGRDSNIYSFLKDKAGRQQAIGFAENAPTYWGDQPIVAAPAYIGALIVLLFVLGCFLVKNPIKKWLIASSIFAILLSWGKNFGILTDLFIDFVPLYDKFRAVSSIQVIAELAFPIMAILALERIMSKEVSIQKKQDALKWSILFVGGLALIFTLFGTSLFSFESFRDASYESMLPGLSEAILEDRKAIFRKDSLRSLMLVIVAGGFLFFYLKGKLKNNLLWVGLLILILLDLVLVDKRYVNAEDFVGKKQLENPFPITQIDQLILEDKSHYRVMNFTVNPMNDGSTSFYHNSIGGYHAAKPRRYQELFDFQIANNNVEVLNMLNTKYFIFPDNNNQTHVQINEEANGNAWFVDELIFVENADLEIKILDSLNTKRITVAHNTFKEKVQKTEFVSDSTAIIELKKYSPNQMVYESSSSTDQFAVFSEIYYEKGWNAYIDGNLTPHIRVNYVLRGMEIPKGKHEVVFKFEPQVIKTGSMISKISYALLLIIPVGWYFIEKKKQSGEEV